MRLRGDSVHVHDGAVALDATARRNVLEPDSVGELEYRRGGVDGHVPPLHVVQPTVPRHPPPQGYSPLLLLAAL